MLRDGKFITIDQSRLVPGDIVSIQAGMVYCDMAVLVGETVVDESSLTGESMPVVKAAVDETNTHEYDPVHYHKHSTVFAGTTVLNQGNTREQQGCEPGSCCKDWLLHSERRAPARNVFRKAQAVQV